MTAEPIRQPTPPTPDLGALLLRVAAGDEAALAGFYDATCALVHGLAVRILGDAHAAEEVTIEVYHQVWQRSGDFDAARGTPTAWLLAVARNRAIDRLRSRTVQREHTVSLADEHQQLPTEQPCPAQVAQLADRSALVRRALRSLPPEQLQVIELAFFEGLSHGAISKRLGQPLGTVKTRIRTGVRRLAEALCPIEDHR